MSNSDYMPMNAEQFEEHLAKIGDYTTVALLLDLNKRLESAEAELQQIRNAALSRN